MIINHHTRNFSFMQQKFAHNAGKIARKNKKEMTPDRCVLDQGSFLFRLGFDHWVTSLSAGSTGLFLFGWNPFRSIHVLQLTIAIGIYVKRKMGKVQSAGVITVFGITFFVTSE